MENKVVSDRSKLFIGSDSECHEIKVSPDSDEVLRVWIKQPTWLQVEQALSTVMNIDSSKSIYGHRLEQDVQVHGDKFHR